MLFEPAGEGTHEILATDFALPVVGFAAGGAVGSDVVGGFLEDDFGHCFVCEVWEEKGEEGAKENKTEN